MSNEAKTAATEAMTEITARIVLEADLHMLASAAGRIQQRMRFWPTVYISGCISIATVIVAFANLAAEAGTARSLELSRENKQFLSIVGFFLYAIGVIQIASFARDRKHYVRILNCLNDLRQRSCEVLKIKGNYSSLWANQDIKVWPVDSTSTLSFASLLAVSMLLLISSLVALSLSTNMVWVIALIALAAKFALICKVSK